MDQYDWLRGRQQGRSDASETQDCVPRGQNDVERQNRNWGCEFDESAGKPAAPLTKSRAGGDGKFSAASLAVRALKRGPCILHFAFSHSS